MIRKTILGLFSILVITSALSPVYAEIMSPLQQLNDGVENNMIQCNTDKILMESKSGKPACVYETTAEKLVNRGWTVILSEINMMDKISEMKLDESVISDINSTHEIFDVDRISVTTKASEGGHGMWLDYRSDRTLDFPSSVNVGDIFTINYIIDPKHQTPKDLVEKNFGVVIETPTEFSVITESDRMFFSGIDKYEKHGRITNVFTFTDDMIDSNTIKGSITIRLDEPLIHSADQILVVTGNYKRTPLSVSETASGVSLSIATTSIAYDPDRSRSIEGDPYTFDLESYVPQEKPIIPSECVTNAEWEKLRNNPKELEKYDGFVCIDDPTPLLPIPETAWDGYAYFLREVQTDFDVTDIEGYLQNSTDFTQEFIDEYLNAYPEFRVQSHGGASGYGFLDD